MNRTPGVVAAALAFAVSGCFADEHPGPPCVDGLAVGQSLVVRLGQTYDVKSDYWYDGTQEGFFVDGRTPSCATIDGWKTDAVVTLVIKEPLFDGGTCAPWRADLQPPVLADSRLVVSNDIAPIPRQTIAASFEEGTLGGRTVLFNRGLFTPSEDFRGPLVSRQRPPLVVTRHMFRDDNWSDGCYDAWIASWEGTPP